MDPTEENSGLNRYHELQAEAKKLGVTASGNSEQLEAAIEAKKAEVPKTVLTSEEAAKIDARLKYEFEVQEKFRAERQTQIDRASIMVESKTLSIPIELSEKPTELELAKARQLLGMKKVEKKPSPETVRIEGGICPVTGKKYEPSKKGYYIFTNREQDDASHTPNLGGKYVFHLIPDQIHVLSEYHIKKWRQIAVTPVYQRVPVAGPPVEGQMGEVCKRTGGKPRFSFDYLGEAPQDAPFGIVTDTKVLNELKPQPLEV
ncbi:hypothetical protein LCGC14_0704030 [marine sediment metagenome]|uniref:Uncharacterized protein n=1 Tax=marine sediment metagenome TaxID=412755 RepID=A0A0F9T2X8_9ZZZZ